METTVREHIRRLEQRRDRVTAQIMEESNVDTRNKLETELRAVESALKSYRDALETERRLFQANSRST